MSSDLWSALADLVTAFGFLYVFAWMRRVERWIKGGGGW